MNDRDDVLTRTLGQLAFYFLGGSLVIWLCRGPIWPLVISLVALFFVLVGFTALSKADDERNRKNRRRRR